MIQTTKVVMMTRRSITAIQAVAISMRGMRNMRVGRRMITVAIMVFRSVAVIINRPTNLVIMGWLVGTISGKMLVCIASKTPPLLGRRGAAVLEIKAKSSRTEGCKWDMTQCE
jgi:hypothetical protein